MVRKSILYFFVTRRKFSNLESSATNYGDKAKYLRLKCRLEFVEWKGTFLLINIYLIIQMKPKINLTH